MGRGAFDAGQLNRKRVNARQRDPSVCIRTVRALCVGPVWRTTRQRARSPRDVMSRTDIRIGYHTPPPHRRRRVSPPAVPDRGGGEAGNNTRKITSKHPSAAPSPTAYRTKMHCIARAPDCSNIRMGVRVLRTIIVQMTHARVFARTGQRSSSSSYVLPQLCKWFRCHRHWRSRSCILSKDFYRTDLRNGSNFNAAYVDRGLPGSA